MEPITAQHRFVECFDSDYGIDTQLVQRLISESMRNGGDHVEIYFERRIARGMQLQEQRLTGLTCSVIQGLGVRVIAGDAIGYAFTDGFDFDDMLRTARAASAIASTGTMSRPIPVAPHNASRFYDLDQHSVDQPQAAKMSLMRRADSAARAYASTITSVTAKYQESLRHIIVATSRGRLARDVQPHVSLDVTVTSERGQDRQSAQSGWAGRANLSLFDELSPETLAHDASRVAVQLHDAREAPVGVIPVVLGPGESGVLIHEAIGHGLEADFNRKRVSMYAGRIGLQVASPLITLVDDGTLPYAYGSVNVDDEGTPGQRTVLIEDGVLCGYMQDWLSARHFGVQPTGNGRRENFRMQPQPRMRNTFVLAGETDPHSIIRSVDFGVYCARSGGGSVNIGRGDFIFNMTEAYLIEEGRITAPLGRSTLSGNGPAVLTRISMVGNDLSVTRGNWVCGKNDQTVCVTHGAPTLLISELSVGVARP